MCLFQINLGDGAGPRCDSGGAFAADGLLLWLVLVAALVLLVDVLFEGVGLLCDVVDDSERGRRHRLTTVS